MRWLFPVVSVVVGIGVLSTGSAMASPPSCEPSSRSMVANGSFNDGIFCAGSPTSFEVNSRPSHEEYFYMYPNGEFIYRPDSDFTGADSFTFHASNADGDSGVVTITINVYPAFCFSVANATHTDQPMPLAAGWLGNFCRGEGPLTYEISRAPEHGSISGFDPDTGALTYTPDPGYEGEDSLGFRASNSLGSSEEATLFIAVGSEPTCEDFSTATTPGQGKQISLRCGGFQPWGLSYEIVRRPYHGGVYDFDSQTGKLTYFPSIGFGGRDSFTYRAYNGVGSSVEATVSVDVEPYCQSAEIGVRYEEPHHLSLACGGAGPLTYELGSLPEHGSISDFDPAGGTLTYTPDPGFEGNDSVGFFASNALGGSRYEAWGFISICDGPSTPDCVEVLPTAVSDSATVPEDAGATAIDVLANDTDTDGGPKKVISRGNGSHGTVAIIGAGTGVTYDPTPNFCGADSFVYGLNGGSKATVSVTVSCVDDPPTAHADSGTALEGGPAQTIDVLANDTDIDAGPKAIVAKTDGLHGTVTIAGGAGELTYTPLAGYCGSDSFTYTLNGGSVATVTISITCVMKPPNVPEGNPQGAVPITVPGPAPGNSSVAAIAVSPGVGVVSAARRPKIGIAGAFALFTLACLKDSDCSGTVTIAADLPSLTPGSPAENVTLVRGRYRIGAAHSALIRAKLTHRGLEALGPMRSLKGVAARMAIADTASSERGQIDVSLVRRPKASRSPREGGSR